jgi:hypothetical protein
VVVGGLELGDAVDDLDVQQAAGLIERDRLADRLVALGDLGVAQEHRRAEPGDEQSDGEHGDGDAGDLRAQADAAPPR